jgi:catechol 2,3-dioxygenase-like lactoylglutathione lyase family enzyme
MPEPTVSPQYNPHWSGFHHIALVTPDLDATIQFYTKVLGMKLSGNGIAPANPMHGRHAGLMADQKLPQFLHFFEYKDAEIVAPPDMNTMHWLPGALHHISIILPDEAEARAVYNHIESLGIETTGIMDQGDIWNFLFKDNNGIVIEAAWDKI